MPPQHRQNAIHPTAESTRLPAALQVALYLAIVALPLLLAAVFRPATDHGFLHELAKSFALAGAAILALQFALAARLRWVERIFGLDLMLQYHKTMAVFAGLLVLAHPLLLAYANSNWRLITSLNLPWPLLLGKLTLFLIFIQIVTSIFPALFRLRFHHWRKLHNMAIIIFLALFTHSWLVGGDLSETPLKILWVLLLAGVLGVYANHKLILPKRIKSNAYQVASVTPAAPGVWTIRMTPPAGEKHFDFLPGQFLFLTLYRADASLPVEEHPFTIASSPASDFIECTIKESGDFTSTIGLTKPNDRAAVNAPYGRFTYTLRPEQKDLVFIAGGIGITPHISMLRYMRDTSTDYNVLLLYGNRSVESIVFKAELDAIAASTHPHLRVVHALESPPPDWPGESGLIDREKITRLAGPDLAAKAYYICGPKIMNEKMRALLTDLGVPADNINFEHFGL